MPSEDYQKVQLHFIYAPVNLFWPHPVGCGTLTESELCLALEELES